MDELKRTKAAPFAQNVRKYTDNAAATVIEGY